MTKRSAGTDDPRSQGAQPPFPKQHQTPPGSEAAMQPQPDFGEATYRGFNRLEGKTALITGGDSGIGRAVALAYAREGADVLISYLNEEADAHETCRAIADSGGRVVAIPGDIGEPEHCRSLVHEAVANFGRLDILVNNAAYQMTYDNLTDAAPEEIAHTFRTNILAMFYLCQAAWPHLQPGSAIINVASIQAYQPSAQLLPYAATKGAIVTFTKGLAEEAIERGIRVNAVAPGPVWTPLIPSTMPPEQTANFGKQSPIGRPAQPAELAPLFVFLATDESRYITGEVVGITGGKPLS